ncbi:MAG: phenylacetate--CoA ligase [Oscillospiraceae bacterium]
MEKSIWSPAETAPLHEIKALQSYRLSQTIRRVYENVPFYRAKLNEMGMTPDDIKSVDDLARLPFTYKQDLRDNYPYGLFATPMENVVRIHASSGTTGKQTVVGYTKNDLDCWADCTARALTAAGAGAKDFVHVSYGYGLFTGGLGIHDGAARIGASVIPASTGNTKRQLQILRDFHSTVLCCTPSYALFLGEALRDAGIDLNQISLRCGIFGAEPWTDGMRKRVEELLGLKAHDIYGLSEIMGPGVAYECEAQSGMHISEDCFIPEIIDPVSGKTLPDGEKGELVFTTITKEALPLIRYRTHDITSLTREPCACGRTFIKMQKVMGRSDDMLIIRGVNVFPSQIETVLMELGMPPHYLLVINRSNNLDTLEIQVEMADTMEFDAVRLIEQQEREIRRAVESTLGIAAKIRLVSPKSIERSEGKAKRVIDNRVL